MVATDSKTTRVGVWEIHVADGCQFARVVRGVEPSQATRVAELFYASFGEKLSGLILPRDREAAVALLAATFCLDNVYAALDSSGRVLGVAFVTGRAPVLCPQRGPLAAAYGLLGGSLIFAAHRIMARLRPVRSKSVWGLEGFSVDPLCRGRGIGSAMIECIAADARLEGARAIELNVGDTNPARRLYERSGFVQTRTGGVGPFAGRLGFKRLVYYELALSDSDIGGGPRRAEGYTRLR